MTNVGSSGLNAGYQDGVRENLVVAELGSSAGVEESEGCCMMHDDWLLVDGI